MLLISLQRRGVSMNIYKMLNTAVVEIGEYITRLEAENKRLKDELDKALTYIDRLQEVRQCGKNMK